jgi:hypothetical protein
MSQGFCWTPSAQRDAGFQTQRGDLTKPRPPAHKRQLKLSGLEVPWQLPRTPYLGSLNAPGTSTVWQLERLSEGNW